MGGRAASRQRGWAGPLLLLVALLVVMVLVATVLKQYVLSPGAAPRAAAGEAPGAAAEGEAGGTQSALERARGLQESVRQQAAEMQKRIDSADQ